MTAAPAIPPFLREWTSSLAPEETAMRVVGIDVDEAKLAEICRRYGIAELAVFGSVARGTSRPGSDVDLLYVLAPEARIGWEIEQLADELATVFGRPVDLVSKRHLHRLIRDDVLAGAEVLYAA
jgi:predicted nucleotidyltransferase